MLDVRRMRVLREVAQCGSFSAAADALAYTQSAVSQQIAALEREAGTRLVERNARGVRLTDAGRALVAHADAILARLADAEDELQAIAGLRGGRLGRRRGPRRRGRAPPLAPHAARHRALPRAPPRRRAHARPGRPGTRPARTARGRRGHLALDRGDVRERRARGPRPRGAP